MFGDNIITTVLSSIVWCYHRWILKFKLYGNSGYNKNNCHDSWLWINKLTSNNNKNH